MDAASNIPNPFVQRASGKPIAGSKPARATANWLNSVRRFLRIRRGFHADGVYYKELTPEPLARALEKRADGAESFKEYRATFADGSKQVIRCSHASVYADIAGPLGVHRLDPVLTRLRPGSRVLEVGAGTGYRALWLSMAVGPSGAVVSLAHDSEHVEYAIKRYRRANIAFELARDFALAGETNASFDAAIALELNDKDPEAPRLIAELWRLLTPGSLMLLGTPPNPTTNSVPRDVLVRLAREGLELTDEKLVDANVESGHGGDLVLTKPQGSHDDD